MTKAAVCTEFSGESSVQLQVWTVGAPGPGAVSIEVRAASVNYPDVPIIRGLYQERIDPPFVSGTECAGVITAVGEGVEGLSVGDRVLAVVGSGGFATDVLASPPLQVHRIPDEMSFLDASAFDITYGTGVHGLVGRGAQQAGESVLVLGASGGCGSAAVRTDRHLLLLQRVPQSPPDLPRYPSTTQPAAYLTGTR